MPEVYKLHNQIKHYEWGSINTIPEFLGMENIREKPHAELWMGTHIFASSKIEFDGKLVGLGEISGELPFLFKLIAVGKPLSIQAHPNKKQAEEGYEREEKAGLTIKAPTRNYKDSNHKPEILCAISPITLMAGFREPEKIYKSLEALLSIAPPLKEIFVPSLNALESGSLLDFFRSLFNLSGIEQEYLCTFINNKDSGKTNGIITAEQWKLIKEFTALYPRDPAILSPLFLNIMTIQPGQAIYIPAGVLHAYLSGFGLELMSSSDNVLRGGLTPKHVDIDELIKVLHFVPFIPQTITPSPSSLWFSYHTTCREFLLSHMQSKNGNVFPGNGPAICIITGGELKTCGKVFKKGESFFIPEGEPPFFEGDYSLYAGWRGGNHNLPVRKTSVSVSAAIRK